MHYKYDLESWTSISYDWIFVMFNPLKSIQDWVESLRHC